MPSIIARLKAQPLWYDMTARSIFVAATSCIGAVVYGYDVSWWSSVLGMPEFTKRYGVYNAATDSYAISAPRQSAGSSIPTAGLFIGAVLCHVLSDRIGRRLTLLVTCIGYIVAIIVEVTADSFWQIVIGRFLNAIPQGVSGILLPMYQAECAPASCRGALIGIYTWFLDVGAVTATGIVYNTWFRTDSGAYKIVMGVQMIYPLIILACLKWLPETPRYLCMKNRDDEALQVLRELRTSTTQADNELKEIKEAMQVHVEEGSWFDLFRGSNLRRTFITLFTASVETWQGLSFIGNYLVVFFISLGTTNTYQLVVLINSTLLITLTLFWWAPDYFGRRTLLLFGSAIMWATFFIMAGVGGTDVSAISPTRQRVCIAMLFIWAIIYSFTWANGTWVTLGEMPTTRLRSKTSGLGFGLQAVFTVVITEFSPYVQSDDYTQWGAYIGFFFGSFSFIAFWFVYFFYPEVKGLTIEEMDLLFERRATIAEFRKATRGEVSFLEGVSDARAVVLAERGEHHAARASVEEMPKAGNVSATVSSA